MLSLVSFRIPSVKMSAIVEDFVRFSIVLLYSVFGLVIHMIKLICDYADSIKCPLFMAYWSVVKYFLKMFFARRSYTKLNYENSADIDRIKRGDAYIDKLIEDFSKEKSHEYDPYLIEDSVVGFDKKVVFVHVSGEAKLYDGHIKGLSTLHRPGHCEVVDMYDGRLLVKAELGAGELEFQYLGSVKFMNLGPTITVHGTLSYIEVHMEFTVDSKTGKNGKLEKFVIDDTRGMKVWVTGLGPLNWALNPIIKGVTKIFKRFVRNFMENKVEKHIYERIPNFQFPVEGEETVPPVSEPQTNPPTEPETSPTEAKTNPPTEPETNPPTEPETNPPTEPETNPPTEPETNPPTEPETNPPTEPETNPPTEPETNPPTEPETNPTEPETNPPTEPETNPPTEPETVPTEPETNPPTEPDTPTEPEPEPETTPTEPEPETTTTEPETNPPTEPETTSTEPETNPPTEQQTIPTEQETTPTEPETNPEEPENPEEPGENPPETDEEEAFLEPDRANERLSESFRGYQSFGESSEEVQNNGEEFPEEKYMSFIDE